MACPIEVTDSQSLDFQVVAGSNSAAQDCFVGSPVEGFEAEGIALSDRRNSAGRYLRAAGLPRCANATCSLPVNMTLALVTPFCFTIANNVAAWPGESLTQPWLAGVPS